MGSLHISIAPEILFTLFGILPVTNSLLSTWLVIALVLLVVLFGTRQLQQVPGYFQSILEVIVEGLSSLFETILHEKTLRYFPLLATFFIFIIFQNWSGLLPGVGTIGIYETAEAESIETTHEPEELGTVEEAVETPHSKFVPLFRAGTADLNTTLALALIAMGTIWYSGFTALGSTYLKRYINLSNPINFFIGILEIISEFSRILSFSFRLFGNIFAGEVLLVVIAFLMPLLLPLPFLGLELFVGFIQALVFTMLTTVFLSLATTNEGH